MLFGSAGQGRLLAGGENPGIPPRNFAGSEPSQQCCVPLLGHRRVVLRSLMACAEVQALYVLTLRSSGWPGCLLLAWLRCPALWREPPPAWPAMSLPGGHSRVGAVEANPTHHCNPGSVSLLSTCYSSQKVSCLICRQLRRRFKREQSLTCLEVPDLGNWNPFWERRPRFLFNAKKVELLTRSLPQRGGGRDPARGQSAPSSVGDLKSVILPRLQLCLCRQLAEAREWRL